MSTSILPFLRVTWTNSSRMRTSVRYSIPLLVQPGVSRSREGIHLLTSKYVEVHVSNRAVDGGANIGVVKLLSNVLKMPRSDVMIVRGECSRKKVVQVRIATKGSDEEKLSFIGDMLARSARLKGLHEVEEEAKEGEEEWQEEKETGKEKRGTKKRRSKK
ncbi:hypothetical protein BDU57DRAFT_516481 [Ampelomyces quisqualis]|uniref:Uncharacterized protein n=1 Tax=Ampelomyces quisqualis TaxID=50730 RepID=A0A6A5QNU6_AMPQU|nr:hypothetical protein BDU57DRAFT_516481 [Ampelomyces quisqualis]